jgi:hypothetical protein
MISTSYKNDFLLDFTDSSKIMKISNHSIGIGNRENEGFTETDESPQK